EGRADGRAIRSSAVAVDRTELSQVVERLTGTSALGRWRSGKIYDPVASATAGLWRVQGGDWSVVLKVVHHGREGHPNWMAGADEDHWAYWKREVLAYRSGLPDALSGGLRGPHCLGIFDRPDGSVALWLEDAGRGTPATSWTLDAYGAGAHHLGRAQGALALADPVPDETWFSRDWLRAYLTQRDGDMHLLSDPTVWAWPLVGNHVSRQWMEPMRDMRAHQPELLEILDAVPVTVCHHDLHPANLFTVDDTTVLIDWASVGGGPLGADAAVLVADAVLDFHVAPEEFDPLFEAVRSGYARGLGEAGWSGPVDAVTRAINATLGARYAWIGPALLGAVVAERSTMNRRPLAEAVDWWARTIPYLLDHGAEAVGTGTGQGPRVR
ncbi:MAG: phosphotransferase, partial [Acidimicrobiales bacterium]